MMTELNSSDIVFPVGLFIAAVAGVFAYGKLNQKVDDTRTKVDEVAKDVTAQREATDEKLEGIRTSVIDVRLLLAKLAAGMEAQQLLQQQSSNHPSK